MFLEQIWIKNKLELADPTNCELCWIKSSNARFFFDKQKNSTSPNAWLVLQSINNLFHSQRNEMGNDRDVYLS